MNKRVHKHLNVVDDKIAEAKACVATGHYQLAAKKLDEAKDAANLAAAEDGKARKKHASSRFVQNTR